MNNNSRHGPGPGFRPPFQGRPRFGYRGPPGGFMGPPQGMNRPLFGPPFEGSFPPMMGMDMGPPGSGGFMGPPPDMGEGGMRPPMPQIDPGKEIWIETLSNDGKTYFYHSKTRESIWKRPTDENVQIILQSEAHLLSSPSFGTFQSNEDKDKKEDKLENNEEKDGENKNEGENNEDGNQDIEKTNDKPPNSDNNFSSPPIINPGELPRFRGDMRGPRGPPPPGMMGMHPMGNPHMGNPPMMMRMPMRPMMPLPGMMPRMGFPPMGNTPFMEWKEHSAPGGRKYYYNVRTMETRWDKPRELADFEGNSHGPPQNDDDTKEDSNDKDQIIPTEVKGELSEEEKAKLRQRPIATKAVPGTPWCVVWTGDEKVFFFNPTTKLSMWVRPPELSDRVDVDRILDDPPHKRKREIEIGLKPQTTADEPEKKKKKTAEELGAEKLQESEKEAEKERSQVPLEVRQSQFRQMLHERQVSAFSTWEKELHKIVFDHRYTALGAKDRKIMFDQYVKTRADEERKEKKAMLVKVREEFKALLSEATANKKLTFSEFAAKFNKDPRFRAIEKMKERESLYREFILESQKKRENEARSKEDKVRKDFFELLESKKVENTSRWSRAKEKINEDKRYSAVDSSHQREQWYNEYMDEHKKKDSNDGSEDRRKRAEESLKARAEQVEREKAERSREIDSERQNHRFDEATQHFKALLSDMVRNTEQSWSDTRRQLKKDGRWDLADLLSRDEKERYFNAHVDSLFKRKRSAFKQLLEETTSIALTTRWKSAKKLIRDDPRFTKFISSDRKREREFDDFMKEKFIQAKSNFRNLLRECKMINHKTKSSLSSGSQTIKDIAYVLEKDKRYLVLDCVPEEREDIIMSFINDLHRRGTPPPPTASEPSRRGI